MNTRRFGTVAELMIQILYNLVNDEIIKEQKILDPACGTGNFLLNLPSYIKFKNVFASDIDEESIKIARLNMSLKYGITDNIILKEHIKVSDFINDEFETKFDIILGNPPWGYSYNKNEKITLSKRYYSAFGNNVESYDLFIEKAMKVSKAGGYISYVLPEALLNVKSHTRIRELILEKFDIKYIEYLGNVFDKVVCPSIIIVLNKTDKPTNLIGTKIKTNKETFTINEKRTISADYFSLTMNNFDYVIIKKIKEHRNVVYLHMTIKRHYH